MADYTNTQIGVDFKLSDDIQIDTTGDLQLIGQNNAADNVWQAVWLRIITTLGTYLFAKNYGTTVKQAIDDPITSQRLTNLKNQIRNSITADNRVASLNNLSVEQDSNALNHIVVSFGIITVNGQSSYGTATL